jgi:hypothetical protein
MEFDYLDYEDGDWHHEKEVKNITEYDLLMLLHVKVYRTNYHEN